MGRIVIGGPYEPMPIVGYGSRSSVKVSDEITFYVSCEGQQPFNAQLVRLYNGDLNKQGPGLKEREVPSSIDGSYPSRIQSTYPGSFGLVSDTAETLGGSEAFSLQAMVYPTNLGSRSQALMSRWDESSKSGYALVLDEMGQLTLLTGDGSGSIERLSTGAGLIERVWYLVGASIDVQSGKVILSQVPIVNPYNGRLGRVASVESSRAEVQGRVSHKPAAAKTGVFTIAALVDRVLEGSGRVVATSHFDGKIDRPRVLEGGLSSGSLSAPEGLIKPADRALASWDFSANISREGILPLDEVADTSGNGFTMSLANSPTWAVTGHNWDGSEYDFTRDPEQFGAVHFHHDDILDCEWDPSFTLSVPDDCPSGCYAVRLRASIEGIEEEDYVPFFVRPATGVPTSRVALLVPTATYLAYANDNMAADSEDAIVLENTIGSVPIMGKEDLARQQHREWGVSTYDTRADGSGVCYSSWLRPIVNVRPKYRHTLSRVWQYNADLHLVDWFSEMGYEVDIITDQDLHSEGAELLRPYKVVVSGTHPEYCSAPMLDGIEEYLNSGGRFMYLGGNGYYWVVTFQPGNVNVMEVRKWGGTEAWTAEPGERYLSFSGEMGGLWRNRGRAPQKLFGTGFIAQGLDIATHYVRRADGFLPENSWIFDGIDDKKIGDFGLEGGGAAGMEIDACDTSLGTPPQTHLVASSEGHTSLMLEVRENYGITQPFMGGNVNPKVRADIVYFPTDNGGGVFSSSSISWCGSLSYNNYQNNVSRITKNVLDRFLSEQPLN